MKKKVILYGIIAVIVLAVQLIVLFIYHFIAFPLTTQDVLDNIKSKNAVANEEYSGAWVYLVETDDGYILHTLSESPFLNRFRYDRIREFSDLFRIVIPGKRDYLLLDVRGTDIQINADPFPSRVVSTWNVVNFFVLAIAGTNLIYPLIIRKKNKRREE